MHGTAAEEPSCVLFIVDAVVAHDDRDPAPGHRRQAPWRAHREAGGAGPQQWQKLARGRFQQVVGQGFIVGHQRCRCAPAVVALQHHGPVRPLPRPAVELAKQMLMGSHMGGDPLLDQGQQQGLLGWGTWCVLREPEARADHRWNTKACGPVEGERSELSALVLAAHQQKITPQAQAEILNQGIPHQRHEGAAEQRRWCPSDCPAEVLIGLDEAWDLVRVLQEEADG